MKYGVRGESQRILRGSGEVCSVNGGEGSGDVVAEAKFPALNDMHVSQQRLS